MKKLDILNRNIILMSLILFGSIILMGVFYPKPPYETGKEFLKILLDITGILFGIGGIFATFLLKNVYDVRETFKKRYETTGKHHIRTQLKEMRKLILNVIKMIGFFFMLSIAAVIFSFFLILIMDISSGGLGLCFGLVINSFVILFLTFDHQTHMIEGIEYIIYAEGAFEGLASNQ